MAESDDLSPESIQKIIHGLQGAMREEAAGRAPPDENRVKVLIREALQEDREERKRDLDLIWNEMKQFVPSEQINQRLERLGLPPDHHEEIAVALRAYIWVYKFASKIGLGIIAAAVSALAAYFFKAVFKIDLDIGGHV